jgi:hypothetical protein
MTFDECVVEVLGWFKNATKEDQEFFKLTPKNELHKYHFGLGMKIRNECGLWKEPWIPWKEEIIDGVDYSPDHPDAVSTQIIKTVWDKIQEENI